MGRRASFVFEAQKSNMTKPSKKNTGVDFEQLSKELFELASENDLYTTIEGPRVFLDGKDGKREFDLVLKSKVAGIEITTVVECRDYNSRLDISHLDGFISKMRDVNANKGVIVTRKGYSKKAQKKLKD